MLGFENMIAGMIGMTPAQMQGFVQGLLATAESAAKNLDVLVKQQAEVIDRLERLEKNG